VNEPRTPDTPASAGPDNPYAGADGAPGADDAAVQAAYGCINGQVAVGDDGDGFATVNEQAVLVQHDAIVKDTRALVIEGYGSSWWR